MVALEIDGAASSGIFGPTDRLTLQFTRNDLALHRLDYRDRRGRLTGSRLSLI